MQRDDSSKTRRAVSAEERAEFVMSFIEQSDQPRQDMLPIWEETLSNYFVRPQIDTARSGDTTNPLNRVAGTRGGRFGRSVLVDPESHQIVETLLAKLWSAMFAEPNFISAKASGREDAFRSDTVSRLLEYDLNLPGVTRSFYEWLKDSLIFGTGMLEIFWKYEEGPRRFRSIDVDMFGGLISDFQTLLAPIYDDPVIRPVSIMDFFPDPGQPRMSWMRVAAKRFRMTVREAESMIGRPGWDTTAIKKAVNNHCDSDARTDQDRYFVEDLKRTTESKTPHEYRPMIGYELWGEVPWNTQDGFNREVITVLSGETVRSRHWPLHSTTLPFFDATINPIEGRFYGMAPLEAARYDQDFASTLKRMICNAVVRGTLAQPIVNKQSLFNTAKLRSFDPEVPIEVQGSPRDSVEYLTYNPPLQGAADAYGMLKSHMREGSGALGAIQGLGLGSKRFSATEASETFQQAFDRPEMIASLIERDSLPPIGQFLLGLNQYMLDDEDTELSKRVGEEPGHVVLADIMGEFDVRFVGSRMQHNRATKTQGLERFVSIIGNLPPIAARIDWDLFTDEYAHALDLEKIRSSLGSPQVMTKNVMLQQMLGANGQNANGAQPILAPAGSQPAQIGGGMA